MSDSEHDPIVPADGEIHDDRKRRLSRRIFLKSSGAAVASAGAAVEDGGRAGDGPGGDAGWHARRGWNAGDGDR